jgi:hypothetical protein
MAINHRRSVSTEPLAVLRDGLEALLDVGILPRSLLAALSASHHLYSNRFP